MITILAHTVLPNVRLLWIVLLNLRFMPHSNQSNIYMKTDLCFFYANIHFFLQKIKHYSSYLLKVLFAGKSIKVLFAGNESNLGNKIPGNMALTFHRHFIGRYLGNF